ncbi:CLUMA_CG010540, isoform A [Clunio marinus]|uniref:CLUMA_CG010540, isoform A n=1 Tax=Clunio marinus TaxID=568069 RepID=A0A1J1IA33_9DIPT|nr:CLUMA_CG010540, isoform A [Clunio marinus]
MQQILPEILKKMEIECSYRMDYFTPFHTKTYICDVSSANIINPQQKIESFEGKHLPGKSKLEVGAIIFKDTIVKYFPVGLQKFFPNLKHLKIERCGLKEIYSSDMASLNKLTALIIERNHLKWLPEDLFVTMPKLSHISFNNNKLECLSPNMLTPIKEIISVAAFNDNFNFDKSFGEDDDSGIESIEELMEHIENNSEPYKEYVERLFRKKYSNSVFQGFAELWNSEKFSDFIIKVDSREFKVHKLVLACQSSVFSAMFENEMQENQLNEMKIEDFNVPAVYDFLRYLYKGEITNILNGMDLFALSMKYDVSTLKELSQKMILENINKSNAVEILHLGHLYCSEVLKRRAFQIIQTIFPNKTLTENLMNYPEIFQKFLQTKKECDEKLQEAERIFNGEITTHIIAFHLN